MDDNRITTLFELYLLGRRIRSEVKKHNADKMLLAIILRFLRKKSCTVGELAEYLYSTLSTISEKIVHLEEQGLVRKTLTGDQRERLIVLTTKGKKLVCEMETKIREHCTTIFKSLTQAEALQLIMLLQKIDLTVPK